MVSSYESIKLWRDAHIEEHVSDSNRLNQFHDDLMLKVFKVASLGMHSPPPCPFVWFITGSGGRYEQGIFSDQDHGIVFLEDSPESYEYFSRLGEWLSVGLEKVGYPYCEGKVMSSNPMWCQSLKAWELQLVKWMEESSWSSIRNLQIFYDARTLVGDHKLLFVLKEIVHKYNNSHPHFLRRLLENVKHMKNVIGPLGQIIVEDKGVHAGAIDLKYAAFIPYVNAIRLLALKEGVHETNTVARLNELSKKPPYEEELPLYIVNFTKLLQYRLEQRIQAGNYDDSHYLYLKNLTKEDQRTMKKILKDGKRLQQFVQRLIEKGGSHGV